jgi:branched-subunit amino acid transport protein
MWAAILAGAAGCWGLKAAGLAVPDRVLDHPGVRRFAALLPVALLAALTALQTLTTGDRVVIDARLAGVAVAVVAVMRRAPFLLVVALAAATAALLRHVGLAA